MAKDKGQNKKRPAASFRFDAAVHDRLRRHAKVRNVSNTELLTELIVGLEGSASEPVDLALVESAAIACIAALDLLKSAGPKHEQISAATLHLGEVLDHLSKGRAS